MIYRLFFLILTLSAIIPAHARVAIPPDTLPASRFPIPSPEAFVNAVFYTVVDSSWSHYYLIEGTDSCRFTKYDYDEWSKYTLKEPVPLTTLNELSEKVYHAGAPYFWKQDLLQKAICITRKQGDSIIYPGFYKRSPNGHPTKKQLRKTGARPDNRPVQDAYVFSFSLPQFTGDGQYAVIDLNFICGVACGEGFTCLFHRTTSGWKLIGKYTNWSS
jgi:hypothetical protein